MRTLLALLFVFSYKIVAQTCCSGNVSNIWVEVLGNDHSNSKYQMNLQSDCRKFEALDIVSMSAMHHHNSNSTMATVDFTVFTNLSVKYNINSKYALQIMLPYLIAKGNPSNRNSFADASILVIRRFIFENNLHANFSLGVKLPTSKVASAKESNNLTVFGSGSFDPLFVASAQKVWNRLYLNADVMMRYAAANKYNFNFGSYSSQNISVGYNLLKTIDCSASDSLKEQKKLLAFAGVSNEIIGMQKQGNFVDATTGGSAQYANVNLVYGFNKFVFSASYLQPFRQVWSSMQPSINYRFRTSISINF